MKKTTVSRMLLILLGLFAICQFGGQTAAQTQPSTTSVLFYDGSGNLQYVCAADSVQKNFSTIPTVTAASNASSVSVTSTAHGFDANSNPVVIISGAVGAWAAINGSHVATVTGVNTFTVAFDSTSTGTFSGQAWVVVSYSPRLTAAHWSVLRMSYDGSGNVTDAMWANGTSNPGAICANRASLSYQ